MTLDAVKPFFPLVGSPAALILSAVVPPTVRQWFTLYREHHPMIRCQFFIPPRFP